jgi:hypothetical protein
MKSIDQLLQENPTFTLEPAFSVFFDIFNEKLVRYDEPKLKDNKVVWAEIVPLSSDEKEIFLQVHKNGALAERDNLFRHLDWRYNRHNREVRLGLEPTDDLTKLDNYGKALADLTLQPDFPKIINWPDQDFSR